MLKHKRVTKAGGVTLPKDIRSAAGILPGVAVDVVTTGDGVIIKKHVPACHICGNAERVASYLGFDLCENCLDEMTAQIKKGE